MLNPMLSNPNNKLSRKLIEYIMSSRDNDYRKRFLQNANKYWRLYQQKKWWMPDEKASDYITNRPVSLENLIFPKVESLVSVFFKHLPLVELRPYKPSDHDLSRENNKHIQYAMKEADMLTVMREGSREAFITGMQIYHTGWDVSRLSTYGNGDCSVEAMPREDVFLDPMPGITDIQRSRFVGIRFWLPFEVVLERFGEKAAQALGMNKGPTSNKTIIP